MNTKEAKIAADLFMEARRNKYGAWSPEDVIKVCEELEALGREWGDPLPANDFGMERGKYYITNSKTHYRPQKDEWTIHWNNGNVGRLQFVAQKYYYAVEDEWNEFLKTMRKNSLDYDPLNCHIVYDIENGKKIIDEYKDICEKTRRAMAKKIKAKDLEETRKLLEKLEKEVLDQPVSI